MLQSRHGIQDGQTDRWNDGVTSIYPPTTLLCRGYQYINITFTGVSPYVVWNTVSLDSNHMSLAQHKPIWVSPLLTHWICHNLAVNYSCKLPIQIQLDCLRLREWYMPIYDQSTHNYCHEDQCIYISMYLYSLVNLVMPQVKLAQGYLIWWHVTPSSARLSC